MLGFEPRSRSNLELAGYKAAVLPLNYRSKLGANGWTQTSYDGVMSAATIHFVLAGELAGDRKIEFRSEVLETSVVPDRPLWYPVTESNRYLCVRSASSCTLNEPGIKLVRELGFAPKTPVSRTGMLLDYTIPCQRPPNRTASTSIRGSEATTTPVTD